MLQDDREEAGKAAQQTFTTFRFSRSTNNDTYIRVMKFAIA